MATEASRSPFSSVFKVLKADGEIAVGFSNINLWASTGVYALNRMLSNNYHRAFHYGRSVAIYGEPGSGKTLLLAQTAAHEQKVNNTYIVWVDVETATDNQAGREWFSHVGVDISEDKFSYIRMATFSKAFKAMVEFTKDYKKRSKEGEMPPIMFIFDSYSALQTDSQFDQNQGKKALTQDQGQTTKQLGEFVKRLNSMIGGYNILVAGVLHVQMSQDEYGPRHKTTGGLKVAYMASQALLLTKYELTNEKAEAYNRISEDSDDAKKVIGIRSRASVLKCRFAKPFENINLEVIYPKGIDQYSGLMDLMVEDGLIISPSQGWYEFTRPDGSKQKFRRRDFTKYADELMSFPIPEAGGVEPDPVAVKDQLGLVGDVELEADPISEQIGETAYNGKI